MKKSSPLHLFALIILTEDGKEVDRTPFLIGEIPSEKVTGPALARMLNHGWKLWWKIQNLDRAFLFDTSELVDLRASSNRRLGGSADLDQEYGFFLVPDVREKKQKDSARQMKKHLMEAADGKLSEKRLSVLKCFEIRAMALDLQIHGRNLMKTLSSLTEDMELPLAEMELVVTEARWGTEGFEDGKEPESLEDSTMDRVVNSLVLNEDIDRALAGDSRSWSTHEERTRSMVDTVAFVKTGIK